MANSRHDSLFPFSNTGQHWLPSKHQNSSHIERYSEDDSKYKDEMS